MIGYGSTTSFATIRQGAISGTDAKVRKVKLSLNWAGPIKLAVDPASCTFNVTPDGRPLATKLLYLDLPNYMLGADAHSLRAVAQYKPYTNRHDTVDLPQYLSTILTQYALNNNNTTTSPPIHPTNDDVSVTPERLEVDKISKNQSVRVLGGVIPVPFETHWKRLLRPSWELQ